MFLLLIVCIGVSSSPPPLWNPKMLKFFVLNPILSFKSNYFLVKISQFEFLVMTEKNIFGYQLSLSLNTLSPLPPPHPLKEINPLFSTNPL